MSEHQALNVNLLPSKQLIFLILFFTIESLAVIYLLFFAWLIKLILVSLMLMYGGIILWRYGLLRHSKSILRLTLNPQRGYLLTTRSEVLTAELCGESTLTTWMCILRFKIPGKYFKHSCIIFRDGTVSDQYRRLLVYLQYKMR